MYSVVYMCMCMWGQQSMLLFHSCSPPYLFEMGALIEHIAHWLARLAGQQALGILLSSCHHKVKVTDVHNHMTFTWLSGI